MNRNVQYNKSNNSILLLYTKKCSNYLYVIFFSVIIEHKCAKLPEAPTLFINKRQINYVQNLFEINHRT